MLLIGTSGFSFEDWRGTVYPSNIKKEKMLAFYEQELGFKTLEVNYTYYQLPSQRTMRSLAERTSDNFVFVVKCYREMTHEIWNGENRIKNNREIFTLFFDGLEPLIEKKKLGCVLAQFPPTFFPRPDTYDYLVCCRERLRGIPLIIEFRNRSWVREETFQFLKKNNLGFCCVDEPRLPRLMPFVVRVTSDIGYFRFHGRNRNWFRASVAERYNYLYSEEELRSFLPVLRKIVDHAVTTYAFFNNCHGGFAARNARQLEDIIGEDN